MLTYIILNIRGTKSIFFYYLNYWTMSIWNPYTSMENLPLAFYGGSNGVAQHVSPFENLLWARGRGGIFPQKYFPRSFLENLSNVINLNPIWLFQHEYGKHTFFLLPHPKFSVASCAPPSKMFMLVPSLSQQNTSRKSFIGCIGFQMV